MAERTAATIQDERAVTIEQDSVQGFAMSCGQALGVAKGYLAIADVMGAVGLSSLQAAYAGRAQGVLEGACPR